MTTRPSPKRRKYLMHKYNAMCQLAHFSTLLLKLRKNWFLLLSTLAAASLFYEPNGINSKIRFFSLLSLLLFITFTDVSPEHFPSGSQNKLKTTTSYVIAFAIILFGLHTFLSRWRYSSKAIMLSSALGFPNNVIVILVGLLLSTIGFFSIYKFSTIFIAHLWKETSTAKPEPNILKRNIILPVSAVSFLILYSSLKPLFSLSFILSITVILVVAAQFPPINNYLKQTPILVKTLSLCAAFGECLVAQEHFLKEYSLQSTINLEPLVNGNAVYIISLALFFVSIPFVYICIVYFWNNFIDIIKNSSLLNDITKKELLIYCLVTGLSILFITAVFSKTNAFYAPSSKNNNIIFRFDSNYTVVCNSYLDIRQFENDIRQPLFAVFSAPFIGIPYLFSKFFVSEQIRAILENIVQIFLLFFANFALAKAMRLNAIKRICFMLLCSVSFMQLLSILVMEQYIIAYFYLSIFIFQITENNDHRQFISYAASGTLITSSVLFPFILKRTSFSNFKSSFKSIINWVFHFLVINLAFFRFEIFYWTPNRISFLSQFADTNCNFESKLCQYTEFLHNIFFSPNVIIKNDMDISSIQLAPIQHLNLFGILIFLAVLISAIFNRKKKSSLLAFGWVIYSIIILLIIGWGTVENSLILYSLYFGWALLVLLFQLVEHVEEKLGTRLLVPCFTGFAMISMVLCNIDGVKELIGFAISNYPV